MVTAVESRPLEIEDALRVVEAGGIFVDLRPTNDYLDVHIPGSLALLYEFGPGMSSHARDCIPLELPLILVGTEEVDVTHAAASLKGKGFAVEGHVPEGVRAWGEAKGTPASTDVATGPRPPQGTVLDVGDPGAERVADALHVPVDRLWIRMSEIPHDEVVVIVAGYGVRAALAIGMLERAGIEKIAFWKSRSRG